METTLNIILGLAAWLLLAIPACAVIVGPRDPDEENHDDQP